MRYWDFCAAGTTIRGIRILATIFVKESPTMNRTRLTTALCSALALSAVVPAYAADDITISRPHRMASSLSSKLYFGASLGYANYKEVDDSSAAYGLFGGYHINEVLAVDVGWSSLGEATENSVSADVSVFHLGLLGKIPMRTDLTLFGKLGLANWDYDLSGTTPSGSDSDVDAFIGLGADYNINGQSAVRFGLDLYSMKPTIGNVTLPKERISVFSVGFSFSP
jgi:hypothetical protein